MTQDEIYSIVQAAADKYGVPSTALLAIAHIESKGNVNAQNSTSSASGLFQFVDSTAQEYGLTGDKRNDPTAQANAAARMMASNSRSLERTLGRAPDAGELYLAHQQGLGGAKALLSNPNKSALEVLTGVYGSEAKARKALSGNGGNANMTASQFSQQWVNKGNGVAGRIPPGAVGNGNAVATQLDVTRPAPTPATRSAQVVRQQAQVDLQTQLDRVATTRRNAVTPATRTPAVAPRTNAGDNLALNPVRAAVPAAAAVRTDTNGHIVSGAPSASDLARGNPVGKPPATRVVQSVSMPPLAPRPSTVSASDRARGKSAAPAAITRTAGLAGTVQMVPGARPSVIPSTAPINNPTPPDPAYNAPGNPLGRSPLIVTAPNQPVGSIVAKAPYRLPASPALGFGPVAAPVTTPALAAIRQATTAKQSGGLSRDAAALRSAGQVTAASMRGKPAVTPVRSPAVTPRVAKPIAVSQPSAPSGGRSPSGGTRPGTVVGTATGNVYNVGQIYSNGNGSYIVNADGSFTNIANGRRETGSSGSSGSSRGVDRYTGDAASRPGGT